MEGHGVGGSSGGEGRKADGKDSEGGEVDGAEEKLSFKTNTHLSF